MSPEQRRMSSDRARNYSKQEKDLESDLEKQLKGLTEEQRYKRLKELLEFEVNSEFYGHLKVPDWIGRDPSPGTSGSRVLSEKTTEQLRTSIIRKFVERKLGTEKTKRIEEKYGRGMEKYNKEFEKKFKI